MRFNAVSCLCVLHAKMKWISFENFSTSTGVKAGEKNCLMFSHLSFCFLSVIVFVIHLKIGYGIWGSEPGSAGILLVAKGSIEGLGDGAQIEGADSRGRYTVPKGYNHRQITEI